MHLKVCTPYYNSICKRTNDSVGKLKHSGLAVDWKIAQSTYIGQTRNRLVAGGAGPKAQTHPDIDGDYTHYLHLDSDIAFEVEDVMRLLAHDVPIVSGAYAYRGDREKATAGFWAISEGDTGAYVSLSKGGLQRVDWCGAGFLLVKREVFEQLKCPWFCHPLSTFEHGGVSYSIESGEDQGFCIKAARAGYEILLDSDCVVSHIIDRSEAMSEEKKEQYIVPGQPKQSVINIDEIIGGVQRGARVIGFEMDKLSDAFFMLVKQNAENAKIIEKLKAENSALTQKLETHTRTYK